MPYYVSEHYTYFLNYKYVQLLLLVEYSAHIRSTCGFCCKQKTNQSRAAIQFCVIMYEIVHKHKVNNFWICLYRKLSTWCLIMAQGKSPTRIRNHGVFMWANNVYMIPHMEVKSVVICSLTTIVNFWTYTVGKYILA